MPRLELSRKEFIDFILTKLFRPRTGTTACCYDCVSMKSLTNTEPAATPTKRAESVPKLARLCHS